MTGSFIALFSILYKMSPMNNEPPINQGGLADDLNALKPEGSDSVVANDLDLYRERQKAILDFETKKTSRMLFTIAAVALASNLLTLLIVRVPINEVIIDLLAVPVVVALFGGMALKEPLVGAILTMLLFFGVWIYNYTVIGQKSITQGWLIKFVVLALLIGCIRHARIANKIKRELKL
jgi:hypothetical protein